MMTNVSTMLRPAAIMAYWTIRWIFRAAIWVVGTLISLLSTENSKTNVILCVFRGEFSQAISNMFPSFSFLWVLLGIFATVGGGIFMVLVTNLIAKVVRRVVDAITAILPIICWIGVVTFLVVIEPAGSFCFLIIFFAVLLVYVYVMKFVRMVKSAIQEFVLAIKSTPTILLAITIRGIIVAAKIAMSTSRVFLFASVWWLTSVKPHEEAPSEEVPLRCSSVKAPSTVQQEVIIPVSKNKRVSVDSSGKCRTIRWNRFQQARFSPAFNKKMLAREERERLHKQFKAIIT